MSSFFACPPYPPEQRGTHFRTTSYRDSISLFSDAYPVSVQGERLPPDVAREVSDQPRLVEWQNHAC